MAHKDGIIAHRAMVFDTSSFTVPVSVFYRLLEELFAARRLPGTKVSRVFLSEGGILAAQREYVRVKRGPLVYHISAAVLGNNVMVSWWLRKLPSRLWLKFLLGFLFVFSVLDDVSMPAYQAVANTLGCIFVFAFFVGFGLFMIGKIPFVGGFVWPAAKWMWRTMRLPTLFQSDAEAAFQSLVPTLIEQAIQALRSAQGLRSLEAGEPRILSPVTGG